MVKRQSLTDQVRTQIKQRIRNQEFDEGRIPPEMELAQEFGVSRTTIRDALSRLESEGVIWRRQGAGTFVNATGLQIKTRLEEMWSYEAVLRAHGYAPSTTILSLEQVTPATPHVAAIAAELALPPAAPLLRVQKLFHEDDLPVIFTINFIPAGLVVEPYQEADFLPPVYAFLRDKCRQQLAYYLSDIVPVCATPELARILAIPPQTPLISFEESGYSEQHHPLLKAFSYFRDDLFRLRLMRRQP